MEREIVLKKIKKLELASGTLAIMAPFTAALIGAHNKMLVLVIIGGIGVALQPYIYSLYNRINEAEVYKRKKFWPLLSALFFILFLVLNNYYNWFYR